MKRKYKLHIMAVDCPVCGGMYKDIPCEVCGYDGEVIKEKTGKDAIIRHCKRMLEVAL